MNPSEALFSLAGKTAFVTGATGHLGLQISIGLAEAGAHVLLNGRNSDRVDATVELLRSQGLSAESAIFDITDGVAIADYFHNRACFPLHIIVNNAYNGTAGNIASTDSGSYIKSYEIGLASVHNILKEALPCLKAAIAADNSASIINIASMYAMVSPDQRIYDSHTVANPPFYGACKAALIQWTKYAACEFGLHGIRVNAISPGPFPSNSVQNDRPDFIAKLAAKVPMGRIGQPGELKGPVLFLASSASSYVNGINLVVDGGWTCW